MSEEELDYNLLEVEKGNRRFGVFIKNHIHDLEKENQKLKEKINTYENPEDLTLMFMYCDEKAKDKIKQLKEVIEEAEDMLDLIIPELWNINNAMTYKIQAVKRVLDKAKDVK